MHFVDRDDLAAEIEGNLISGRAFVTGDQEVTERQSCLLVLIHPETEESLELCAQAVYVKTDEPGAGVGLELASFDPESLDRLRSFARSKSKKEAGATTEAGDLYTRVRHYTAAEQLRAAREGDLRERVALEQIYGKAVWEVLLRNPRITAPEIIRISRTPKLPKQLVEVITNNASWLAVSTLRRSLLMNPRVTGACLDKVLRATPRAELTLIAKQSSYPMNVRQAIKRIQGR